MGETTVEMFDGVDVDTGDAPGQDAAGPLADLTAEELAAVLASRAAAGARAGAAVEGS